eukprot:gene55222-73767_t
MSVSPAAETRRFTDARSAVAEIARLYDHSVTTLREGFIAYTKGNEPS